MLDEHIFEARRATLDGRLEDAVAAAEQLEIRSEELGSPVFGLQFYMVAAYTPLVYLGRLDEALAKTGRAGRVAVAADSSGDRFHQLGLLSHLGREQEARVLSMKP